MSGVAQPFRAAILKIDVINLHIGKYGRMRKHYLKEHRPALYTNKAADQFEWVRRMNSIQSRAEEIVLNELVYC